MSTMLRSSAIASAFGIALLGGVLTGSTMTVPDEVAKKGDLRLASTECADCEGGERLTHYNTDVVVDTGAGIITLVRERIGD